MANPYLEVLKAKRMKMAVGHSNPTSHVMGGPTPKLSNKSVSSYEGAKITSPKMDNDSAYIKKAGPTKANRVKAKKVKKFKKAGSGGSVGKSYGTYGK